MGSGEAGAPAKAPPKASAAQEEEPPLPPPPPAAASGPGQPAAAVYPDWSAFQAYSPVPPHGFFHAASPQPHPYMWGPQQLMPPYGTVPPPYVMYPPGGLYAHPSIPQGSHPFSPYAMPSPNGNAEASGATPGDVDAGGKSSEGKERTPINRSKGSLGSLNMITGKSNDELGKTSGASADGVFSQSGESGSEGSSEGSDANSQNDSQPKTSGGIDSFDAETSQKGNPQHGSQNGVTSTPSNAMLKQNTSIMPMPTVGAPEWVAGPTTNLNIGMDYWGAPNPSPITSIRGKVPAAALPGSMVPGGPSELRDERELRRQRRKQSNRESARRSRLRKQAECEELAQRVEILKEENASHRAEVNRIRKEYDQLLSQNASLKERLGDIPKGSGDSRLDINGQHAGDESHPKHLDSDVQTGKTDSPE